MSTTTSTTLCVPPREGELCAPVRFDLTEDVTFMELTARHRITRVEWDDETSAVALWVDITDPETARPVHVRFDVAEPGTEIGVRGQVLAMIDRRGERRVVVGTYLGVVSEEN